MNFSILTVFKELYGPFLQTSLIGRAREQKRINVDVQEFFSFVEPKQRIDSATFGPGAGMLIKPEVVQRGIQAQEKKLGKAYKIFFSPQGKKLDQHLLKEIAHQIKSTNHLMLIPARYEGMDARVEEYYADLIVSVGDFVLMGGDLPAMMLMEGVCRLIPGIVGKQESVQEESFSGPLVDYPEFTEPVEWNGLSVPEIIRSGNHGAIAQWRTEQAARKTVRGHFGWLRAQHLSKEDKAVVTPFIPPHYVAILHGDVLIGPEREVGTTSVTSVDIHDISRSAATYGIKSFYITTPLKDQQHIVQTLLDFWKEGGGKDYNWSRYEAIKRTHIAHDLDAVIADIKQREGGVDPVLIATSAQPTHEEGKQITYLDQAKVWAQERPVLIILGTGRGLAPSVMNRADFVLLPIHGFTAFNHLSVRSAGAIILDRWLGINEKYAKKLAE